MPTPDDAMLSPPAEEHESQHAGRPTCPPDELRIHLRHETPSQHIVQSHDHDNTSSHATSSYSSAPTADRASQMRPPTGSQNKAPETELEGPIRDIPTPMSATEESAEEQRNTQTSPTAAQASTSAVWCPPSLVAFPHPKHRFLPNSSSSFLRPGSRFEGSQTSDHQKYDVQVEIKHVDMKESFLCGYLRIKGLTQDHPSLTTYFESEIIGSKYTFITQHPEWGSNEKVDRQHWGRFPAYKPISKYSSRPDLITKDWSNKEHLFMRWKEYFLVPDHRVRTINGASFEGFYYICFNQISGSISGIYFHSKSEKYQRLELNHIHDFGCQGAIEFR